MSGPLLRVRSIDLLGGMPEEGLSMRKKDLVPYKLAKKLRTAVNSCARTTPEAALLCEHALTAADWLEREADDLMRLRGSVTHAHLEGRITTGCILNVTPNAGGEA